MLLAFLHFDVDYVACKRSFMEPIKFAITKIGNSKIVPKHPKDCIKTPFLKQIVI